MRVMYKIWRLQTLVRINYKNLNEGCLELKATRKAKLKNLDLIEYYGYCYMPLLISSYVIYLLCLKFEVHWT